MEAKDKKWSAALRRAAQSDFAYGVRAFAARHSTLAAAQIAVAHMARARFIHINRKLRPSAVQISSARGTFRHLKGDSNFPTRVVYARPTLARPSALLPNLVG
jgi:hypothetical protein